MDGKEVTDKTVKRELIGTDVPGTVVRVTLLDPKTVIASLLPSFPRSLSTALAVEGLGMVGAAVTWRESRTRRRRWS